MTWSDLKDLRLENNVVLLRRLRVTDLDDLMRIAIDPNIWTYFVTRIESAVDVERFLEEAVKDTLNGTRAVFAIVDCRTNAIVGSTAYGNLAPQERRLEVGWSWVGTAFRRTGINRAAKFALLDHAFTALNCERVEFKTDILNSTARQALLQLGAVEEGTLRSFNYMPGGRRRDAIYYSILRAEWQDIKREKFPGIGSVPSADPINESQVKK